MGSTRTLVVTFRAVGQDKVKRAGKTAEDGVAGVGRAAKKAGEELDEASDSTRSLSESLVDDLGGALGGALDGFDDVSGVIGQVDNAVKLLSGVLAADLVGTIQTTIAWLSDKEAKMAEAKAEAERYTKAIEDAKGAVTEFSAAIETNIEDLSNQQIAFAVGNSQAIKTGTENVLQASANLAKSQQELDTARNRLAVARAAAQRGEAGSGTAQIAAEKEVKRLAQANEAFTTVVAAQRAELRRAKQALVEEVNAKKEANERTKLLRAGYVEQAKAAALNVPIAGDLARAFLEYDAAQTKAAKSTKRATGAMREQRDTVAALLADFERQDALREGTIKLLDEIAADEESNRRAVEGLFAGIRAGQQLVVDGYTAIGNAAQQMGAVQEYIHQQNMAMIAAEVEADAARAQGVIGSASFLAEQLGAGTRLLAGLKAADAIADAATETAKAFASAAAYDFWAAGQHGLSAAGFTVAAAKHLATAAGGGGGSGGGGGAVALSAPSPPTDSDIAGGGGRRGGRGDSVINVTFAGDVYDTREAADRALASRAIRGTNSLSRTAGTPRVRAAAIRDR